MIGKFILSPNVAMFSLVTLLISATNFIFLPVITRILSVEEFGIYTLSYTVIQVGAQVLLFGMSSYLSIEMSKNRVNSDAAAGKVFRFFDLLSLGVFCLALILIFISFRLTGVDFLLLATLLTIVYFRSWFLLIANYYRMKENLISFFLFQFVFILTFFLMPIFGSQVFESFDAKEFFYFMVVGYLASFIFIRIHFHSSIGSVVSTIKSKDIQLYKPLAYFGLGAAIHSLLGATLTVADRFIAQSILDATMFSMYALAAQLAAVLSLAFSSYIQSVLPKFYRELEGVKHYPKLKAYIGKLTLVLIVLLILYELLLPLVVRLFFPLKYLEAIFIAKILGVGVFFQGLYALNSGYLFYMKKSALMSKITGVVGLFGLCSTYLLSIYFGVNGVTFGFIFTWFSAFVITLLVCKKVSYESV